MRWCIVGAGAIGGALGARLHSAGQDVVLVARGANLEAIRRDGLTLIDGSGRHRLPVAVAESVAKADPAAADVIVLAVKSQHSRTVLDELASAARLAPPIVCAQNGVENEREALRRFAGVYAASVSLLATHVEPGVVVAHSAPLTGSLHLGRYPVGEPDDAFADAAVAALVDAGFQARAHRDVMPYKWGKLLVNLGTGVEALCGPPARGGELARIVLAEGRRCLDAAGIKVPPEDELAAVPTGSTVVVPRSGGSTWQSLERGAGSVESDYLNGEIVLLGRLMSIATPANALIQRELRALSARGGLPGQVAESDLLRALD